MFVDIVGFTSRSRSWPSTELVRWIEYFEAECSGLVVDHGGRVIKNIGDEVLFVADDVAEAADAALDLTARGADADDDFPEVRAGLAYGDVVVPARRRVRPDRQHRLPAHLGRPARNGR